MARRNRRRGRRFTWFPNLGNDFYSNNSDNQRIAGTTFAVQLTAPTTGTPLGRVIVPLTFDQPLNEAEMPASTRLSAIQGAAWFLRRIVGSLQVARGWHNVQGSPPEHPAVLFGAALAVIPWDEYSNTPEADVNPLLANDINEPWIWRRTVILGAQQVSSSYSTNSPTNALLSFPVNSTFHPQSRFEMLDQKTMRVINGDERLCFIASAAFMTPNDLGSNEDTVFGYFDYRLLGALRRKSNRGGTVN